LADEGAAVVVNYSSSREGADRAVEAIKTAGGKATAIRADVSKADDVERLFAGAKRVYGRLDVLVNNAGVAEPWPLEAIDDGHLRRLFDLNVHALFLPSQKALAYFGDAGGGDVNNQLLHHDLIDATILRLRRLEGGRSTR
jgi:3-oxoacyl-[acyl-carrier protein] reductase